MDSGHLGLPIIARPETHQVMSNFEVRAHTTFSLLANSDPRALERRAKLDGDPRVAKLEGKMISTGNTGSLFRLDRLVAWWLWHANNVGVKTADRDLEQFLDRDEISSLVAIWLYGVELEETIQLTNNVWICPPKEMPDSSDKENAVQGSWNPHAFSNPHFSAALVSEVDVVKVRAEDQVEHKSLQESFDLLDQIALLLNVLPGVCCAIGLRTTYAQTNVPFGPFGGRAGATPIFDVIPKRPLSNFGSDDVESLQRILGGFQKQSDWWRDKLSRSLARLAQSKARENPHDRALDLGIALEMVLLHSDQNNRGLPTQLSNHFRSRGAWLIGQSFEERQSVHKTLGKIYDQRSQVAHNGRLSKSDGDEFHEHIRLAEEILRKLIIDGPPEDWTALVLGKNDPA